MVYREPAEELARQAALAAAASGPLATLDVDGREGADGADGAGGAHGVGSGEDGDGGTAAGRATAGEGGGAIAIVLERDPGRDHVARLHGQLTSWRGAERADQELDFERPGELQLVARGGDGGDGGRGGNGGDGARGRRGSDATRYSSGGNGGPGGDGGDGADGSSGASGGRGGAVVVRVRDADTHLLMLLAHDVGGGDGGRPGANGRGGAGGRGGPGGSSCSWTESQSYTDSNGQSATRTTSHSNSGGSSGRDGRYGRAATAILLEGEDGRDGSFAIEVVGDADRVTRYPGRYDVQLVSFRHRNANEDGIYEPEEKIFITQLEVQNVGAMPTPAHHDVRVGVVDDGWIAPLDQRLVLPRSLRPGERHVFTTEELALSLRVFRPQASAAPLAENETIRFYADLPDARRRFSAFETTATQALGKLVVRFPIEASPLGSLFSLAPGQSARIRWSITNVSEKAYGVRSDLGRAVSVFLGLAREPGLDASELHFFDEHGTRIPLDVGFRRAVPEIAPGQTVAFEGTIAVAETATTYASARLFLAAELGHIDEPQVVRPIQYRELTMRVGRPFDARDADVLIIANNRTTGDELRAWEQLASTLGLTAAVWDAALEDGLTVLSAVAEGKRRYRLVVFLNNTMDTAAGERRASVLLDKATSHALARAGVHVFYVGRFPDLDDLAVPTLDAPADAAVLAADAARAEVVAACESDELGGPGMSLDVRASYAWPWSEAKAEHLEARAEALATLLEKRWPHRRYVVVPRYEPTLEGKVAWIRVYRLGRLVVRRSFDPARGAVSGISVDAEAMHDPAIAQDPRTVAALTASLPFGAKAALLASSPLPFGALRSPEATGCEDVLVAAVLADLVREQTLAASSGWRASSRELESMLPMLAELTRDAFPGPVELASPAGQRLVELAAWLELVARGHARWWEWAPPLLWLRRGTALRSFVREQIAALLRRVAGPPEGAVALRGAIALRERSLHEAWSARRQEYDAPAYARDFAVERVRALGEGRPLESDAQHLAAGGRVIASDRVDALRQKEQARKGRAGTVLARAARARAELLRPESCAELLASAGAGAVRVAVELPAAATREEAEDVASIDDLAGLREKRIPGVD
ncbi:MAG TPA: hypothetical protein VLT33_46825 [Labilithrix sp.]|nr:hypothetical protein [Labilithrix sp.]